MSTSNPTDTVRSSRRAVADDASDMAEAHARDKLRELVAQLRESGNPHSHSPASTTTPTFRIGEAKHFPFVTEKGEYHADRGNLSEDAYKKFMDAMKEAAQKPDIASRDAATGRAAKVVAQDWLNKHHIKQGVVAEERQLLAPELHAMRAQATFVSREIGEKLGLGRVESMALGYSLERALEAHAFRVINNHVWDRAEGYFRASTAAVAGATGMTAALERKMGASLAWLAEHGVTREAVKDLALKHGGRISTIATAFENPEAFRRAAYILSHSDSAIHAIMKMGSDTELRKSVGTLVEASGESLAAGPGVMRAAGSTLIVAGSLLHGDSGGETGRHVFRAALTIAGGIGGAALGAGVASAVTGTAGAIAGDMAADYLLKKYDEITGQHGTAKMQERTIGREQTIDAARTLERKGIEGAQALERTDSAMSRRLDYAFDRMNKDDGIRSLALSESASRQAAEGLKQLEQQPGARINVPGVGEVTHQNAVDAGSMVNWFTRPDDRLAGSHSTPVARDGNARPAVQARNDRTEPHAAAPSSASAVVADLVARGEGGYDSVNLGRRGNYRAAKVPLESMTVAEVMQAQRNGEFNAAGRYQVIGSTLAAAVHAMHLSGNEKFNAATQDRIFDQYLIHEKRSEISNFIEGRSNDLYGAVRAMSREWASVADPTTGASAYASVGNNRASISAEEAAKVLQLARAEYASGQEKRAEPSAAQERDRGGKEMEMAYERHAGKPKST